MESAPSNDDIAAAPLSLTPVWILAGLAAAFLFTSLTIAGLSSTGYKWSIGLLVTGYACLLFAVAIVTGIAPKVGLLASVLLGMPFLVLLLRNDQGSANIGHRLLRASKLAADRANDEVGSLIGVVGGTLHFQRKHQLHVKDVQGTRIDGQGQAFSATTTNVKFPWIENASANGASLRSRDTSVALELADAR